MKIRIHVANQAFQLQGIVDIWESAEFVLRYNDASTWLLKMSANHPKADLFAAGNRIVVYLDDVSIPILSGPIRKRVTKRDSGQATSNLEVSGIDDTARLAFRKVWPNPDATLDAQTVDAYYTASGDAETVLLDLVASQCGPDALTGRPMPGLTIPDSEGRGADVPVSARFTSLLETATSIANAGGIGFRVVQVGDHLELLVTEPSAVHGRFSPKIGNLQEWGWSITAPDTTFAIVAGQGEGTDRTFIERHNSDAESDWSERIEAFIDARDTDDSAVLDQRGDAALADGAAVGGLSQIAIDMPGMRFAHDYSLGDPADVDLGDVVITDAIRQVKLSVDGSNAEITPSVGDPNANQETPEIYSVLRDQKRRIDQLESRQ